MEPISAALALAQFAPSILRFFGVGDKPVAVAEKVVSIAQSITGGATPQEALERMRADAQLAQQFQLAVLAADTELEKAALADREDARARDIEVRKLTGGTNRRADYMVLLDVIGLIACLLVLVFFRKEIPGEVVGLITTISTAFALCLRDAHQFEFGTSRGSRDKDEIFAGMVKGAVPGK